MKGLRNIKAGDNTMPLPKPKSDEAQAQFISRCMSDETAKKEFPDNTQRTAMCMQAWKDKKEIKKDEDGHIVVAENVKVIFNGSINFREQKDD